MTTGGGAARPSRRIVFQGLSALGVAAVLAGCGGDDESAPSAATPSSEDSSASPSEPGKAPSGKSKQPKKPTVDALATTDEIPVGGGIVLTGERIVITQPSRGEFQAFSAVCTHQGQTVGEVKDNTITCNFHGSQYDAATGDVTNGPATAGLDPVKVRVKGDAILRA
ncbi:MAG TPA: Rieske (2Fe-2S) protein [Nocardioides sp.]|nr:Rieske (2Fe-2S) protein [Nocardioides sp.]